MGMVRLEFTVEPFTDGEPGPHVRAAIDAAVATGLAVDVGPFGTTADGPPPAAFDAVRDLLAAAFEQGASRVSVQVTDLGGSRR
jgi:uncharacterized protein YqgV (UPF0045/DUF77 family)